MGVFYGKPDIPFSQVKVYQLPAWLLRRQFYNPIAYGRAMSRAYWRWNHKYALPKHCGLTPVLQMSAGFMALFYLLNYERSLITRTRSTIGNPLVIPMA